MLDIKQHIRQIKDFPKAGITFYDIATLIANPLAWRQVIEILSEEVGNTDAEIIAAIDARGFLCASPVAVKLGLPLLMIRKTGKLPGNLINTSYSLEYAENNLEIQNDIFPKGKKVIIMDDLIATGGTLDAAASLIGQCGLKPIGAIVIIELSELKGQENIRVKLTSLIRY